MQPAELLHERLRHLAVEDPREARKEFLRIFDSGGSALEWFLGHITAPADGRLRHLVASSLRTSMDKERMAPYLIVWHEIETDEFARRAIAAALDGVATESAGQTAPIAGYSRVHCGYRNRRQRMSCGLEQAQTWKNRNN